MATSQQQWRRGSQLLLLAAALALVLLMVAGSADAACSSGWTSCSGKCVNLKTDVKNCGWCGHVCSPAYKWGVAYCSGKTCYTKCPPNWHYDPPTNDCAKN